MRPKQRRRGPRKTKVIGKGWTWEGVQDAVSADTAKGEGRRANRRGLCYMGRGVLGGERGIDSFAYEMTCKGRRGLYFLIIPSKYPL